MKPTITMIDGVWYCSDKANPTVVGKGGSPLSAWTDWSLQYLDFYLVFFN